jgi:hypothetical protein
MSVLESWIKSSSLLNIKKIQFIFRLFISIYFITESLVIYSVDGEKVYDE